MWFVLLSALYSNTYSLLAGTYPYRYIICSLRLCTYSGSIRHTLVFAPPEESYPAPSSPSASIAWASSILHFLSSYLPLIYKTQFFGSHHWVFTYSRCRNEVAISYPQLDFLTRKKSIKNGVQSDYEISCSLFLSRGLLFLDQLFVTGNNRT